METPGGKRKSFPLLVNVLRVDDPLLHRAVELAFEKKGKTEWLELFRADDAQWQQLIESDSPLLPEAIESVYVQACIMDILSQGTCPLPEALMIRYFAVEDKDPVAYAQALKLIENHSGSARFEDFKKIVEKRLREARARQLDSYITGFSDEVADVRLECVECVAAIGDARAVKALSELLNDPSPAVREACASALEKLGSQDVAGSDGQS